MSETLFVWDESKNLINQAKHKISFQTASRVFADPYLLIEQDRVENGERRWQAWGMIDRSLVLLVAFVPLDEHEDDDLIELIRIISARKATPKERRHYESKHQ
jgi:uncharacterized protein